LTGLDLQSTATAHQSNQPMDTLIHTQQQETQHQTSDSSPAAAAAVKQVSSVHTVAPQCNYRWHDAVINIHYHWVHVLCACGVCSCGIYNPHSAYCFTAGYVTTSAYRVAQISHASDSLATYGAI